MRHTWSSVGSLKQKPSTHFCRIMGVTCGLCAAEEIVESEVEIISMVDTETQTIESSFSNSLPVTPPQSVPSSVYSSSVSRMGSGAGKRYSQRLMDKD